MGLVLYDATGDCSVSDVALFLSDDDYHGHDGAGLTDFRHLPPGRGQSRDWRRGAPKTRLSQRQTQRWADFYWIGTDADADAVRGLGRHPTTTVRPHQARRMQVAGQRLGHTAWYRAKFGQAKTEAGEAADNDTACHRRRSSPWGPLPGLPRRHNRHARLVEDDPVELARSNMVLPIESDRDRARDRTRARPPSLERQGAFRAASTSKAALSGVVHLADVASDAELYSLGILYDEPEAKEATSCESDTPHDASFGLDCIAHDTPLYPIQDARRQRQKQRLGQYPGQRLRQPRRRPHHRRGAWPALDRWEHCSAGVESPVVLPLDLSRAQLSDDEALARFLAREEEETTAMETDLLATAATSRPCIHIVYELEDEDEDEEEKEEEKDEKLVEDAEVTSSGAGRDDAGDDAGDDDWVVDMDVPHGDDLDDLDMVWDGAAEHSNSSGNLDAWLVLRGLHDGS